MLDLGLIAFAQPALLFALIALPALWLLLRLTPPAPKSQSFPALRLLFGLHPREETPARTPWWILLLRLAIAALLILASAQPLLNPTARMSGSGPLVLVVDDGWAAAPRWQDRQEAWGALLEQAERQNRAVVLASSAPTQDGAAPFFSDLLSPSEAAERLATLEPKPWPSERGALVTAARNLSLEGSAQVIWLSDGLAHPADEELATTLQRLGSLTVLSHAPGGLAKLLLPPARGSAELSAEVRRAESELPEIVAVDAFAEDGRFLGRAEARFEPGATQAQARFNLPLELRNEAVRLAVSGAGGGGAGAVALLDDRWRRRPVGLYAADGVEAERPLLGELFFLERALAPFTELRRGSIQELLSRDLSVLVLADVGRLTPDERQRIEDWMGRGGLLLRFAGPRLTAAVPPPGSQEDPLLLPVRLRQGDRVLTGSLSWDQDSGLAPFAPDSPFAGLAIPEDVQIERQVLAEPSIDLANRTWARLRDGTPMVTAAPQGEGWSVLIHTSANRDWGTLPISGLFVEMLRRLIDLSEGVGAQGDEGASLPPLQLLDGYGRLTPAWPEATAISSLEGEAPQVPTPAAPAGIYGDSQQRRALNLAPALDALQPLSNLPSGVALTGYEASRERDLMPWLLAAALLLASLDLLVALWLRGLLRGFRPAAQAAALGLALLPLTALSPLPTLAQNLPPEDPQAFALQATIDTRLAYVLTGVPAVDRVSHAGLTGLSEILVARTSIEAAEPFGVTPGRDELAFFPLLYWPVTAQQRPLDSLAQQAVSDYLRNGGTIVFDLREERAGQGFGGLVSPGEASLRRLTAGLEIPPLGQIGPDHVMTKAFYLLQDFPGRFTSPSLWVESVGDNQNDGVASVIVTSNDWAGAWAIDSAGRPLFPMVGGNTQREMSFRVGINLVMYAMTGNYKADQVHIPYILERLGQ